MEKRPSGRPTCWWVSNVKMDLGETGIEDVDLGQIDSEEGVCLDFVNTIMINCYREACTVEPINILACRRL
jgi:hypothetical protein